ncbi:MULTISPECIES: hypothetical protein [unclassified Enterococcus]|uniref:hypothetical protein n=1 Tax=unclassified Enterococcus TaxID=2608891 RepID=UPI001554F8B3|nr:MULTISPECIES: hypothetical protein [unclassified Enterococcus]MBS7576310.1 hypothetical protein [Enterococcus sp. MMGLQ5-2]MBS7583543.1 hypothetical protein [Enterococcus sp. MMGLQ5-1]NPD11405.1 hypothetical protein [Enterococcus sp. MMGLQ5-1]NPD36148.1 hypothetical protein [Enterococcus sp. MMGLQ5-2]
MKDINGNERLLYNQKITEKEREMEEISAQKRQIEQVLFNLEEDLANHHQQLINLNDELVVKGADDYRLNQENETIQHYQFKRIISAQSEQLNHAFKQSINELENEREALYRERNELAWD